MDVRIGAVAAVAVATVNEVQTTVEVIAIIYAPVVSRFYSSPVISIGGNSISSINPEFFLGGQKAIA